MQSSNYYKEEIERLRHKLTELNQSYEQALILEKEYAELEKVERAILDIPRHKEVIAKYIKVLFDDVEIYLSKGRPICSGKIKVKFGDSIIQEFPIFIEEEKDYEYE